MSHTKQGKPRIDRTGQRFGMLVTVACTGEQDSQRHYKWEFLCDCGNTIIRTMDTVRRGDVSSCGCLPKGRTRTRPVKLDK